MNTPRWQRWIQPVLRVARQGAIKFRQTAMQILLKGSIFELATCSDAKARHNDGAKAAEHRQSPFY